MSGKNFDDILLDTFADHQLSRSEKQFLKEILEDIHADEQKLSLYRSKAFEIVRAAMKDEDSRKVVSWLEDVVKALQRSAPAPAAGQQPNDHIRALQPIVEKLNLDFEQYIPVHRGAAPLTKADLWKAVGK